MKNKLVIQKLALFLVFFVLISCGVKFSPQALQTQSGSPEDPGDDPPVPPPTSPLACANPLPGTLKTPMSTLPLHIYISDRTVAYKQCAPFVDATPTQLKMEMDPPGPFVKGDVFKLKTRIEYDNGCESIFQAGALDLSGGFNGLYFGPRGIHNWYCHDFMNPPGTDLIGGIWCGNTTCVSSSVEFVRSNDNPNGVTEDPCTNYSYPALPEPVELSLSTDKTTPLKPGERLRVYATVKYKETKSDGSIQYETIDVPENHLHMDYWGYGRSILVDAGFFGTGVCYQGGENLGQPVYPERSIMLRVRVGNLEQHFEFPIE